MGARVLIVEDTREIAELILAYCQRDGMEGLICLSAEEAILELPAFEPQLVVLDLGLPGADGLDFLNVLRQGRQIPVIVVSARESDEEKIRALKLGADDFVTKPFSPRELQARIEAQLRRAALGGTKESHPTRLDFGPFKLDCLAHRLVGKSGELALSPMEFELLLFLRRHPGRTFSAEELHSQVWGSAHGDLSTVAVHVRRLRCKLGEDPKTPRWICTKAGYGYFFKEGEQ